MEGRIIFRNKLYPSDFNGQYGSVAIKLPMNNNTARNESEIFNLSTTTEEQAISNFVNLLLTRSGERFMQPQLGVGLYYYVFEQNVAAINTQLENKIREQAGIWLPYIIIQNISINSGIDRSTEDGNGINIFISFRVNETGANRTISLFTTAEKNFNIEVQ